MRVRWLYFRIILLFILANGVSFANDKIPESRVRVFSSAEEALKFHALSKDEFYLDAGTYHSEESSLKRQFDLSREIHYPVIVEVRGTHHRVLVGPISTVFAVKQLRKALFPSPGVIKKIHSEIPSPVATVVNKGAAHDPEVMLINSKEKAMHFSAPAQGIFYLQAGAFSSDKNSRVYQQILLKKFNYPVIIQRRGNFHVVLIGPVHSAAEVRALGVIVFG